MAEIATEKDFIGMVSREISSGIDRALAYWLGRIELELVDASFTTAQRIGAIAAIVQEYKQSGGPEELRVASA
jgi:hypothetical protein